MTTPIETIASAEDAARAALEARLAPVLPASRYLQRELRARAFLPPLLAQTLDAPIEVAEMQAFLQREAPDEASLKRGLRRLRTWVVCHVAARDLLGLAPLEEVMEAVTRLAEVTLNHAHDLLHAQLVERYGEPRNADGTPMRLIVVGMGKLGGRELNVSSDIDLIFTYPEEGETVGKRTLSHFDFFTRLGRQLIGALADITEDGFVFRVDMRLRPNGDSGPLVSSFDALEQYFISQGREWERFAWIKGRPLTGSDHKTLAQIVRPFVFRKYLDFGAINALRALHAQIRSQVARKEMAENIKLGPGGIREIEFTAQVFQTIRGGREPALQIRPTVPVLRQLARMGVLPGETVEELAQAYTWLRRLEHRLQYLDDAQTHDLPRQPADRQLIAQAMGYADEAGLQAELARHRAAVSEHFQAACGDPNEGGHDLDTLWSENEGDDATLERLVELGYRQPTESAQRLAQLRGSTRYTQLPEGIRARFDALIPRILEQSGAQPNPDQTLRRTLNLLEAITRRAAYLALLQQYPQALARVVALCSASQWAADYLATHPLLLDELLDARQLEEDSDWPAFAFRLEQLLQAAEPDTERQMDLMREQHHTQVFRILHQDLAGQLEVEQIGDLLSALADVVLAQTLKQCWSKLRNRHRDTPALAVIGYGKLGGKELGYASDLDIVFIYDDESQDASELYARLTQRTLTWLSSRTSAGILFETDTRLRPNGESGLLVSSVEGFAKYQQESAWVWEHQAITRARFVAGDPRVGAAFERVRTDVLRKKRDRAKLAEEVIAMRRKMLDNHRSEEGMFAVKDDPGGLIDLEFIIQYLVLGHAHEHPELVANLGNIALSRIAGELGLIDAGRARAAADGYRALRRMQHRLRLNGEPARVPDDIAVDERAAIIALWKEVFGRAA
ncbi:bifunctional [glutamate--ammonia ligase]-adenylyl-L-tyrosine phosphorylase/[glutamate--ammonia-ligase] adenylyltransferase [Niveibacterium sp. SC-1]|uniref:bifunctional [glutamate--ammonia ligase]-adenylyl-L-tyrosine phosphorylase/[glutamate--ammonia-ligase] adenylyltransferase n=1 Tax=Niveibacterium sp. SC-1 TaxID=3135646 RepID=UPI00311E2B43